MNEYPQSPNRFNTAAAGYGTGGAVQAERVQSPTEKAQRDLDDATNTLHAILSTLEQRLQPVLSPAKPSEVGAGTPPPPSSIAGQISNSANYVRGAIDRLHGMMSRLEV